MFRERWQVTYELYKFLPAYMIHLASWHFESYSIDIAYDYDRRTTRCFKKFKKNIAVVQGCKWCIIHYDRNVMEKKLVALQKQIFPQFDDLQMFIKRMRILHCVVIISARHFLRILIQRFTVVISDAIVSSLISHGCWKENIRQENKQESTAASRSSTRYSQKEKSGLLFPQKAYLFVEKATRSRGHPSMVWRSCWQSVLRKQLKNEPGKSVTLLC